MDNSNCRCRIDCTALAVVAGIVIGIITGFLRFSAIIAVTPAFLWVTFGIAIGFLLFAFITRNGYNTDIPLCRCASFTTFIVGILGTILISIILLAIPFVATSVLGAIITGLLLFFFTILIVSVVCLLRCTYRCGDN